jgi:hypothetical protein
MVNPALQHWMDEQWAEHCATHGFTGGVRDEHPGEDFTYPTISDLATIFDPPKTVAQTPPPTLRGWIRQAVPGRPGLLLAQATFQHLPHIPQQVPAVQQPAQAIPQQVLVGHQLALATLQPVHHAPQLAPAILLPVQAAPQQVQAIHQPVLATLLLPHLTHLPYP